MPVFKSGTIKTLQHGDKDFEPLGRWSAGLFCKVYIHEVPWSLPYDAEFVTNQNMTESDLLSFFPC